MDLVCFRFQGLLCVRRDPNNLKRKPFSELDHHLLEVDYHLRTIQELLRQKDVRTTVVYTQVLNRGGRGVRGPLDPP